MYCYTRFFSRVAQDAVNFGLVLLIVEETGLAVMSSLLVLALVLPSTLSGLVAGAAADRFPKRPLMVFGNLARAAVCFAFVDSGGGVAAFYVLAVLISVARQFTSQAEGAIGPLLVERSELARANAIGQAVGMAAQLVGYGVLTPIALRLFDNPRLLFLVAGVLFLVSSVPAVFIGRHRRPEEEEVGTAFAGGMFTIGWRVLRRDEGSWQAAVELTLISSALIVLGGLIPKYIQDVLELDVEIGALVLSPAVIGVALGLRVAGFLAHRVPHAWLSSVGFVLFVVLLAGLTFVNQEASFLAGYSAFGWLNRVDFGNFDEGEVVAMMIMLPLGFAFSIVSVAGQTVLNDRIPLQLQGRVGATQGAMAAVASSVPVVVAGLLADLAGVMLVMALVSVALGVTAFGTVRRGRQRLGVSASRV